jgi:hypothetical protein
MENDHVTPFDGIARVRKQRKGTKFLVITRITTHNPAFVNEPVDYTRRSECVAIPVSRKTAVEILESLHAGMGHDSDRLVRVSVPDDTPGLCFIGGC